MNTQTYTRGDLKPEVHFIGQIQSGQGFYSTDGLFCEVLFDVGPKWTIIQPPQIKIIQTQTSYANEGSEVIWSHPIDVHFGVEDFSGWPKAIVKVWKLDSVNKIDVCSYGILNFPRIAGYHLLECETWTPIGELTDIPKQINEDSKDKIQIERSLDWKYNVLSFYSNNQPRQSRMMPLLLEQGKDFIQRPKLSTMANGKIIFEIECILRNFKVLGIQ